MLTLQQELDQLRTTVAQKDQDLVQANDKVRHVWCNAGTYTCDMSLRAWFLR